MKANTTSDKVAGLAFEAGVPAIAGDISYAADCEAPVYMYLEGLPDPVAANLKLLQLGRTSAHVYVRCRRCDACKRQRQRVWTARAVAELMASQRTWFGTLTLAPDRATQARYAADRALQSAISDRGDTTNQFQRMVDFVNPEITRFLKRVRKNSGAAMRYLIVAERHEGGGAHNGMPHWHALIHEEVGSVNKRVLDAAWRYGFAKWKLVETMDIRRARYVCKYLSKTAMTRIRASRYYGSALPDALTERILEATQSLTGLRRGELGSSLSEGREGPPSS